MQIPPVLDDVIGSQPYPLLFVTISGAHLYGFASEDSDYDLRGVHVLPVREVIGLEKPTETIDNSSVREGLEIDVVTHDVKKFIALMLRPNGYVLEQLYSPLVLSTTPAHERLKELGEGCVTARHVHHYLGFADNQWKLLNKGQPRVKPLLYTYRVLLTGIHLMRTGEVEANLLRLNEEFKVDCVNELVKRKAEGAEKEPLEPAEIEAHEGEFQRLRLRLEEAGRGTKLPVEPSAARALNELLLDLRLGSL